jgi:potassium/chloride transporter 4/5/6
MSSISAIYTNGIPQTNITNIMIETLGTGIGGSIVVLYFLGVSSFAMIEILGSVKLYLDFYHISYSPYPDLDRFIICLGILACLLLISLYGDKAVDRYLYCFFISRVSIICSAFLVTSLLSFLAGCIINFTPTKISSNLLMSPSFDASSEMSILFPCYVGIFTGLNKVVTLKDPLKSVPKGELAAIFTSSTIYQILYLLIAFGFSRTSLEKDQYTVLMASWPGMNVAVPLVMTVGIASALQCLRSCSKVLYYFSVEDLIPLLRNLSISSEDQTRPVKALLFSWYFSCF